jgi:DNA-binding transcriptional LysR family regulator
MRMTEMELFCKAAETLSFTAAAQLSGTTPSAVSKAVSRLENRLGVKLFQRTTRAIRLTEDGRAYFETCRQALSSIEEVEFALTRGRTRPHGILRISLPFSYGINCVMPLIPRYVERYPEVAKVVVSLSNTITDFVTEGFDMAIRIGTVGDSRLVARLLRNSHYCVVASPAYLRKHGTPFKPDDLRKQPCIDLFLPDAGKPIPWQFCDAGETREVTVASTLCVDHPLAAKSAAINGAGLARLLDFTVTADLHAGTLVEVLSEFRPPGISVSAVYPSNRHLSAKVRTFIDFLVAAQREASPTDFATLRR